MVYGVPLDLSTRFRLQLQDENYPFEFDNNGPYRLTYDSRIIPFAIASVFLIFQVLHFIFLFVKSFFKPSNSESSKDEDLEATRSIGFMQNHVAYIGGKTIFAFMVTRLFGCLTLLYLSTFTLSLCENKTEDLIQLTLCPEAFMVVTYCYASILAFVSLISKRWFTSFTRINIHVLLSAFGVYVYRDLWPLVTYNQQPADKADGILFAKIGVLAVVAIIVPLFIPRRYVPVDPKNPTPDPNPELTASWFSMLTYIFLDPVIYLGYKIPHLPADKLPALSDYDEAKYQTEKSFPHLDVFRGAKRRHLFFGLMRVFRVEYCILALAIVGYGVGGFASPIAINRILHFLENRDSKLELKPWFWIIWLLGGPMIQSLSFQWYIFIATRTLVRTEVLITQLVFEHSLRIRLKAEASNNSKTNPVPSTPVEDSSSVAATSDSASDVTDSSSVVASRGISELSQASTVVVSPDSSKDSSSSTLKDAPQKGKTKEKKEEKKSKSSSDENLIGKINNLVTTDLTNIVFGRDFLLIVLYVPMQVTLCIIFLYQVLGWSAFVGVVIMIALLPIPGYVAKKLQEVQVEKMKLTDARIQAVSETVNVLRMIKLFGWEIKMSDRLQDKREQELKLLWKMKMLDNVNGILSYTFPMVTMMGTYFLYTVIMKQELTASKIFSSMAVFSMLREQFSRLFWQTGIIIQAKVSLDRVHEFLNKTELLDSFIDDARPSLPPVTSNLSLNSVIGFGNATFAWSILEEDGSLTPSSRHFRLRIPEELIFKRNCVNLIIGPTGSGKTSILMALLGEMHFIPSSPDSWFNLPRDGGVAYAAQESWVQNDTIKNNILFGAPYDEDRYRKVIKQCALERDLELFEAGDSTEVGERGLTLSGGQKARITLARAIYSPANVILLDDVLAALDVHTSTWIVDHCFRGDLVEGRTILLVTHNVALTGPIADFIVTVGLDGSIKTEEGHLSSFSDRNASSSTSEVVPAKEDVVEADNSTDKKSAGKLIVTEEVVEGHITLKSIMLLVSSLGGSHPVVFFLIVIASLLVNEWSITFQTWFLGFWGSQFENHLPSEVNSTYYLSIYGGLLILTTVLYTSSYIFYVSGSMRASRTINNKLIDSILGSTLRWLDETPTARIITRCTQDIRAVDGPVPQVFMWLLDLLCGFVTKLAAIILFTPVFIFPGFGVALCGLYLGNMYLKSQLSVKREMSNARSPMLAHFSAAMHGLVSIRAYGAQAAFKDESLKRINFYTRVARMSYNLNRWIGVRIDVLGATFTVALASYLVYWAPVGASNTGFSLSMSVEFTFYILIIVRLYNDFEVQSNSLERIQGYLDIEHEPKPTESGEPPASWPTSGDLRVENLSARYSQNGPKILHDISFHIESGQRIGVVGRTGSGKSSLTLALLRCILTEGSVFFDGLPTNTLNLDSLRSSITIIPQTPELLSGTLRENLDLFDQHDDATLNDALRSAGLFSLQEEAGEARLALDTKIAGGGGNLSVGQRQIIALARAMVRGSKLLILDEATSAIDYKTDVVIQSTLRSQLGKDVTVITVAHRLQTIMDADRIMVLDEGRVAEFGRPKDLLTKPVGMLRALVDSSGDKDILYELAGFDKP